MTNPLRRKWDDAGEDHDPPMIGVLDSVQLLVWLAGLRELRSRDVECSRGEWLIDGDIDAAYPCAVHPDTAPHPDCRPRGPRAGRSRAPWLPPRRLRPPWGV